MRKEMVVHLAMGVGIVLLWAGVGGCSEESDSTHGFSSAALEVGEEGGDVEARLPIEDQGSEDVEGEFDARSSQDAGANALSFCEAYGNACGTWEGEMSCEDWWAATPAGEEGLEGATQACYWAQLDLALEADSDEATELACIGAVGDSPPCVEAEGVSEE